MTKHNTGPRGKVNTDRRKLTVRKAKQRLIDEAFVITLAGRLAGWFVIGLGGSLERRYLNRRRRWDRFIDGSNVFPNEQEAVAELRRLQREGIMAKRTARDVLREYVLGDTECWCCGTSGTEQCHTECTFKSDNPQRWARMAVARETLREADGCE